MKHRQVHCKIAARSIQVQTIAIMCPRMQTFAQNCCAALSIVFMCETVSRDAERALSHADQDGPVACMHILDLCTRVYDTKILHCIRHRRCLVSVGVAGKSELQVLHCMCCALYNPETHCTRYCTPTKVHGLQTMYISSRV